MKFRYEILSDRDGSYVRVAGADDPAARIVVPETIEGLPVRSVGSGAFRSVSGVREIRIPEGVEEIGSFAFYGIQDLQQLILPKTVLGVGLGAVRNLPNLERLTVSFPESGRASLLRDILADTDAALTVLVVMAEGEAELYFPKYVSGHDEDTHARAFHMFLEGSGYAYRETLERKGINFTGYDLIFSRAVNDGVAVASHVAVSRLRFPFKLAASARERYRDYLLAECGEILPAFIRAGERENALFLAENELLIPAAAREGAVLAAEYGDAELAARLAKAGEGIEEDEFDLEELW